MMARGHVVLAGLVGASMAALVATVEVLYGVFSTTYAFAVLAAFHLMVAIALKEAYRKVGGGGVRVLIESFLAQLLAFLAVAPPLYTLYLRFIIG